MGMLTGSVGQLNGPPTQVNATGLSNIEKVPIGWEGRHDIGQRAAMTATVLQFCARVFFFGNGVLLTLSINSVFKQVGNCAVFLGVAKFL